MSDLCYNCSSCHLTVGPCLRDLVQCEICYSWGHLYIFCPRGVTLRDRPYRFWGQYPVNLPSRESTHLLTHVLQACATTATLGTFRTRVRRTTTSVVNVVMTDTWSSFVQSDRPTESVI
jgi:hypothetical protein